MEEVSGTNLSVFFNQWLYQSGHPKLSVTWPLMQKAKALTISISQVQKGTIFKTPLENSDQDGRRQNGGFNPFPGGQNPKIHPCNGFKTTGFIA